MGPQSYTKNYTELKNVKSRRNSSSQGKASKLVKQYLVASPENLYMQVTLYGLNRLHLHVCVMTIKKKQRL